MYPRLLIDREQARQNVTYLRRVCLEQGVEPTAVIKGFNALPELVEVIVGAGYRRIASSRLGQLRQVKESGAGLQTLALRIPMLSEVAELVRWCDLSLNSELETLRAIDREAARQGRRHQVVLMRDLGDLREGVVSRERLYELAQIVENELPQVHLAGIGANLTCYGSIMPTPENLGELVEDARAVEGLIGRKLEIVSGGGSSSLPLVLKGGLPAGITDLRLGDALITPRSLQHYDCYPLAPLSNRVLVLQAEIVEIGEKPTMPRGVIGVDGYGQVRQYQDRGIRRRALLALGLYDIGDSDSLYPLDQGIQVLGGSSDHLILDLEESEQAYRLGDLVEFELGYKAGLFATGNPLVEKVAREKIAN